MVLYQREYGDGENHIYVEEWEGKVPPYDPAFIFDNGDGYYYEIELWRDDNDAFCELVVKKVGGTDVDDAGDGEWYEEMNQSEVEMILGLVENCF